MVQSPLTVSRAQELFNENRYVVIGVSPCLADDSQTLVLSSAELKRHDQQNLQFVRDT